jgi:phosphatidylserine decarboxylase
MSRKIHKRLTVYLGVVLLVFLATYVPRDKDPVQYVDRSSGNLITEQIPGKRWLLWLYDNPAGELALDAVVKRKFVSELYGRMMDKPGSVKKIRPFVTTYHIDLSECRDTLFSSFNDFFTRKLRPSVRPVDPDPAVLVSPADGKLLAYEDLSGEDFIVKGYRFNVYEFLKDSSLAKEFADGSMIIVRLAPVDYHRFHFPVDGTLLYEKKLGGTYYSVNPLALRRKVKLLCENERSYTVISSDHFGKMVMAEVGAAMVGSIIQTSRGPQVVKGEEKGYFKFGGSTIVLFFKKGTVRFDRDLLLNTANHLETAVKMGTHIGVALPAAAGAAAPEAPSAKTSESSETAAAA